MSVFKYEEQTEETPSDDGLDEQLNEGEADEGRAPLGAEFINENEEEEESSQDGEKDSFFLFDKDKGV